MSRYQMSYIVLKPGESIEWDRHLVGEDEDIGNLAIDDLMVTDIELDDLHDDWPGAPIALGAETEDEAVAEAKRRWDALYRSQSGALPNGYRVLDTTRERGTDDLVTIWVRTAPDWVRWE
jgi:hypothetical protein